MCRFVTIRFELLRPAGTAYRPASRASNIPHVSFHLREQVFPIFPTVASHPNPFPDFLVAEHVEAHATQRAGFLPIPYENGLNFPTHNAIIEARDWFPGAIGYSPEKREPQWL
jgi:hypothetical protein